MTSQMPDLVRFRGTEFIVTAVEEVALSAEEMRRRAAPVIEELARRHGSTLPPPGPR